MLDQLQRRRVVVVGDSADCALPQCKGNLVPAECPACAVPRTSLVADQSYLRQNVRSGLDIRLHAPCPGNRGRTGCRHGEICRLRRAAIVIDHLLHQLQVRRLVIVRDRAGDVSACGQLNLVGCRECSAVAFPDTGRAIAFSRIWRLRQRVLHIGLYRRWIGRCSKARSISTYAVTAEATLARSRQCPCGSQGRASIVIHHFFDQGQRRFYGNIGNVKGLTSAFGLGVRDSAVHIGAGVILGVVPAYTGRNISNPIVVPVNARNGERLRYLVNIDYSLLKIAAGILLVLWFAIVKRAAW